MSTKLQLNKVNGEKPPAKKEGGMTTPRAIAESMSTLKNLSKGGNVLDAMVAFASGHKMTDLQAAIMLQRAYRRHFTQKKFQEDRAAALKIQSMKRGQQERQDFLDKQRAGSTLAAAWKGKNDRDKARVLRAIVRMQAAWRGKVGRAEVAQMRKGRKAKRTMSWGRKEKAKKDLSKPAAEAADDAPKKQTVRRTMSFDMKPRKKEAPKPSLDPAPDPKALADAKALQLSANADAAKQLLFVFLTKGADGLGLELDATNTVLVVIKGGAAAKQGTLQVGDCISSVDGQPLQGRLLQDVMDPNRSCFSFDVWRTQITAAPVAPEKKKIKRTLSWDRRK